MTIGSTLGQGSAHCGKQHRYFVVVRRIARQVGFEARTGAVETICPREEDAETLVGKSGSRHRASQDFRLLGGFRDLSLFDQRHPEVDARLPVLWIDLQYLVEAEFSLAMRSEFREVGDEGIEARLPAPAVEEQDRGRRQRVPRLGVTSAATAGASRLATAHAEGGFQISALLPEINARLLDASS